MTRFSSKSTAAPNPLWTVEAEAIATHAHIEVRRYDFPRPNEMWEIDDEPIFSMSLPRPGGAHGTVQYEAGATPAQKVGTMMLNDTGNNAAMGAGSFPGLNVSCAKATKKPCQTLYVADYRLDDE